MRPRRETPHPAIPHRPQEAAPPVRSDGVPRSRRARRKGAAIFTVCVVALLAVAGYFAYSAYQHVTPFLTGPGCQAGRGTSAVSLDPQQASIAATIAAVAASEQLPARAVTIAYATAMQESHMHNLSYGDLDSVGVFQQRPSEGWGTRQPARGSGVRHAPSSSAR